MGRARVAEKGLTTTEGQELSTVLKIRPVEMREVKGEEVAFSTEDLSAIFGESVEKVETYSSSFQPTPAWKEPGDTCFGFYLGTDEGVGPNKSAMHRFAGPGDVKFSVWGSTIIDKLMSQARPRVGDKVALIFKGEQETSRGQNPVMLFDIKLVRVGSPN